jgi:hypothetical protein
MSSGYPASTARGRRPVFSEWESSAESFSFFPRDESCPDMRSPANRGCSLSRVIEAAPAQAEKFFRPERVGHGQFEDEPLFQAQLRQCYPQLFPTQRGFISIREALRRLNAPGRVFHQELLIDGLSKNILSISFDLEHAVRGARFRQVVQVNLQLKLVELFRRDILERIEQILLDDALLVPRRLGFPVRLF